MKYELTEEGKEELENAIDAVSDPFDGVNIEMYSNLSPELILKNPSKKLLDAHKIMSEYTNWLITEAEDIWNNMD